MDTVAAVWPRLAYWKGWSRVPGLYAPSECCARQVMSGRPGHIPSSTRLYDAWHVYGSMGMKALLVSILFLASLMPVSARAQLCQGLEITIEGSDAAEVLMGTDGPDVIAGLGGDDVINGLDGADVICGGAGNDVIDGGREQLTATGAIRPIEAFLVSGDQIDGGPGQDVCRGDVGVDFSQNCEASRDMELDFRFLTLNADDGTPLDGALFVPAGETRRAGRDPTAS